MRCVAKYLHERLPQHPTEIVIEIDSKQFKLEIGIDGEVTVDMGAPIFEPQLVPAAFVTKSERYPLEIAQEKFDVGIVSMGNPHAVFVVDNLNEHPIERIGRAMQEHPRFPRQVNAGFMQIENRSHIQLRVWERVVPAKL